MTTEGTTISADDYKRMAFLLESLPAAVLTCTMDGQPINLSPQFRALFGYDKSTLGSRKLNDLIMPELKAEFDRFFNSASLQKDAGICSCQTKLKNANGISLNVVISLRKISVLRERTGLSDELFNLCIIPFI